MTKAPIIFVWVGKKIPSYAHESLSFCKSSNPNKEIIFITNLEIDNDIKNFARIIKVTENSLQKFRSQIPKMQFQGEFWVNTSLRFWVLDEFIQNAGIKNFFHAELDNVIFNIDGIEKALNEIGSGMFVPRDEENRAIASLMYCNRTQSLQELLGLYFEFDSPLNDMDALGKYAKHHAKYFFSLPTESFEENDSKWTLVDPKILGGIFDAATIGQFLLGVDPIHTKFKPSRNGFINENCNLDLGKVEFVERDSRIFIRFKSNGFLFPIFNIHLHSKNWKAFKRMIQNKKILKKLNRGKTSIVSNHSMALLGPPMILFKKIFIYLSIILKKIF